MDARAFRAVVLWQLDDELLRTFADGRGGRLDGHTDGNIGLNAPQIDLCLLEYLTRLLVTLRSPA